MARILIIDPDPAVHEALALHWPELYTLIRAETQEQGLALLRSNPVDLVVIEHRLPDGAGLDLLRQIKITLPQLPVVMITAHGSEAVCATALKLGVRDYFIKPCNVDDVLTSINGILSIRLLPGERRQSVLMSDRLQGSPAVSKTARLEPSALRLQRAVRLIQEKYWDTLSLGLVAREVGLGYFALSRCFKGAMGVTFRRYLLQFRITKAKDLLCHSHYSVTEIAQMVGFSDLPRFDKVFRALVGTSPSAYRVSQASEQTPTTPEQQTTSPPFTLPLDFTRRAARFHPRGPRRKGPASPRPVETRESEPK